jgi:anthranilate phosphoribosyltransferase
LVAAGYAGDLSEGIGIAQKSIDTGAAKEKLNALIRFTQKNG